MVETEMLSLRMDATIAERVDLMRRLRGVTKTEYMTEAIVKQLDVDEDRYRAVIEQLRETEQQAREGM